MVVTAAELLAGTRTPAERSKIGQLLEELVVADLVLEIAVLAGMFCRDFRQTHGVEIPDALIAATARIHGVRRVTRNLRHFPMLDDVVAPYRLN